MIEGKRVTKVVNGHTVGARSLVIDEQNERRLFEISSSNGSREAGLITISPPDRIMTYFTSVNATNLQERPSFVTKQPEGWLGVREVP